MKDLLIRRYSESGYYACFNRRNGFMARIPLGESEPFWNVRGPELLDISITNYCERGCTFCYRKSNIDGTFMSLELFETIISQAEKCGVMQVALGGGNPNQHPQFIEILEAARKHHIIPSYTTNGQAMTDKIYDATKEYCGAIAVSWYEPFTDAKRVIEECHKRKINVNIHYLLHKNSVASATHLLNDKCEVLDKVNAIVFLNYKPIHSSQDLCLCDDTALEAFLQSVYKYQGCKIGFDSCMISYLVKHHGHIVPETMDFCEAGRFSAYISEQGFLYPCSFMNDTTIDGVDLAKNTLESGWKYGAQFQKIREQLSQPGTQCYPIHACTACEKYTMCHGGCPLFPINRCREG